MAKGHDEITPAPLSSLDAGCLLDEWGRAGMATNAAGLSEDVKRCSSLITCI